MLEGFYDYRSPFSDWIPPTAFSHANTLGKGWYIDSSPHAKWFIAREAYATNHQATDLSDVLRYVTLDNPPPAKDLYRHEETIKPSQVRQVLAVIAVLAGLVFVMGIACTLITSLV